MASDTQKGTALALLASAQWGATGIWQYDEYQYALMRKT